MLTLDTDTRSAAHYAASARARDAELRRTDALSLASRDGDALHARAAGNRRFGGRGGGRRGGGGAPAFDPRAYGTLAWWLRGDDMTLNGSDVSSWNDKSGNARHWTQGTAANQPAQSVASLNGRNGVIFVAAAAEVLTWGGLGALALAAAETFIVVKAPADPSVGTTGALWQTGSDTSTNYYPFSDGGVYDGFGSTARKTTGNPTPGLAVPRVYSVVSVANEWSSYIDGVQHYTTGTNTVGWPAIGKLGSSTIGAPVYGSQQVWEWIAYTAKLSAANRAAVVAGLKNYYGGW